MTERTTEDPGRALPYREIERWYDDFAATYDGEFTTERDEAENEIVMGAIRRARCVKRGGFRVEVGRGEIWDLGCGTGLVLDRLAVHQDDYLGIDVSSRMVDIARWKHPDHRFVVGDAMQIVQADVAEGFQADIAVCLWAANFANLERLVNACWLALPPGGRVVFTVNGPGRVRSHNEIEVPELWRPVSAVELARAFHRGFRYQIRGMSAVDRLPPRLLPLEVRTLGRLNLYRSRHFIVEGVKR